MKVGAPQEMTSILDEISKENNLISSSRHSSEIGADPELDEFMVINKKLNPHHIS